jgi:hypothetical protein
LLQDVFTILCCIVIYCIKQQQILTVLIWYQNDNILWMFSIKNVMLVWPLTYYCLSTVSDPSGLVYFEEHHNIAFGPVHSSVLYYWQKLLTKLTIWASPFKLSTKQSLNSDQESQAAVLFSWTVSRKVFVHWWFLLRVNSVTLFWVAQDSSLQQTWPRRLHSWNVCFNNLFFKPHFQRCHMVWENVL